VQASGKALAHCCGLQDATTFVWKARPNGPPSLLLLSDSLAAAPPTQLHAQMNSCVGALTDQPCRGRGRQPPVLSGFARPGSAPGSTAEARARAVGSLWVAESPARGQLAHNLEARGPRTACQARCY